jgi:butyryl-CoA dehydrogenase
VGRAAAGRQKALFVANPFPTPFQPGPRADAPGCLAGGVRVQFDLTKEQLMVRQLAYDFAQNEVKPVAADYDESETFIWEIVRKMAPLGFLGMLVPQRYGGAGSDTVSYAIVIEELSRVCGSTGITVAAHNSLCTGHILKHGNDEQKAKYLPKLATGEWLGAWGLTEANAGSDASATATTAALDGDEWVINGSKTFITHGSIAGVTVVMARTDPGKGTRGISAILVENGTPGYTYGKDEKKLGLRGTVTSELFFEDCRVPRENLLGERGKGFIGALEILDEGRISIAAMALGLGQGSFDLALQYAKEREQFGQPIANFQAVQWFLADMATELAAARCSRTPRGSTARSPPWQSSTPPRWAPGAPTGPSRYTGDTATRATTRPSAS